MVRLFITSEMSPFEIESGDLGVYFNATADFNDAERICHNIQRAGSTLGYDGPILKCYIYEYQATLIREIRGHD